MNIAKREGSLGQLSEETIERMDEESIRCSELDRRDQLFEARISKEIQPEKLEEQVMKSY